MTDKQDRQMPGAGIPWTPTPQDDPQCPAQDTVICPYCTHQFHATSDKTRDHIEAQAKEIAELRAALAKIKRMKSEPIGETGFAVGPLALFQACQRIARDTLKGIG